MAKLIKILAASVGGGLVLGVGIRLGEAIAAQIPVSGIEPDQKLAERLGEMENRLLHLEAESPAGTRESGAQPEGESEVRVRGELRDWLEESVAVRMAEVESRLRTESERGQKQMLDAFAESVQTRVIHRISSLEEEVASQSAAMSELRECSLRTERSVHKLLGGLDKLIVRNPAWAEEAGEAVNPAPADASAGMTAAESGSRPGPLAAPAPDPEPPPVIEPSALETRPKSSWWKIFG